MKGIHMNRTLAATTIALLFALGVQAQATLTGKWEGKTKGGSKVALDLTANKTTLTGTLTEDGGTLTIADGKVSKNTFTFTVTLGDRTEVFSGKFAGDEMSIWMERRGPESAAILTRVKEKK
jgi:hypothetical protein